MPDYRSLLSRIEHPSPASGREHAGQLDVLRNSVREHLELILNTRHGSSLTVPDFGTREFSDTSTGTAAFDEIKKDVVLSISRYEPRLTEVEVLYSPDADDPLTLHFDIIAKLVTPDGAEGAVFHSRIMTSGEVSVKTNG
jgi:type VI secretion system protein